MDSEHRNDDPWSASINEVMATGEHYLITATNEVLRNDASLSDAEFECAITALCEHTPDEQRLYTEVKQQYPEVTFAWDTEAQAVYLKDLPKVTT